MKVIGVRDVLPLRRSYAAASWIWVAMFTLRVVVQVPLYLAGLVGALGVAKVVMGWPLFLAAAYVTYLVLRPALRAAREERHARESESPATAGDAAATGERTG